MPGRKVHNYIDVLCGIPLSLADKVNADMDRPARELGPRHRIVNHDLSFALEEARKYQTPLAFFAAVNHINVDGMTASSPALRKMFAVLEALS